ncbi:MAG TPA: SGNH/GDSL hydrolase family protein [Terriglobia bacterium]|nr:SGNH/GDSL hydrolase family protein [Terriglobia bacterium]
MRKNLLLGVAVALTAPFFSTPAWRQLVKEFNPAQGSCCRNPLAKYVAAALDDWNQLSRYYADDERMEGEPAQPGRVVFMGDSITDFWNLAGSFPGKPYINRGISGQITSQMLVRMFPDVVDLHPAAVIILAGTNDIAGNYGPETAEMVKENIAAMTELAERHGIRVILCSLTPVSDYTRHKQTTHRPPAEILELNRWIRAYAGKAHATFADYYAATVDGRGIFRKGYSNDGLHPNAQGYKLLAPVAGTAIENALSAPHS